jgi:hypothetical protein
MATNSNDVIDIDFNNDWKYYCQNSNEKIDERTIISTTNNIDTDKRWTSIELPHLIDKSSTKKSNKYWYRKQFDWTSTKQQIYLNCQSYNNDDNKSRSSNINGTIWLNDTQIFSDSLKSLRDPIELSTKLLHSEKMNILIICCENSSLSLSIYLTIHGKIICATGQVDIDENIVDKQKDADNKQHDVLDYTVSVDNADGRIDVIFKPKRKFKVASTPSPPLKHSSIDENQTNVNKGALDDDLLVPRLAIVILIVGTRGDVQPFIA